MTQTAVLEQIAELLDREHGAIAATDVDELAAIELERRTLIARLGPASAADRDVLATVELRRARNELAAEAAVARLGGSLGRLGRGRVALAGYSPIAASTPLSRALDREV
jgi:hypothetical protein